jgi:hypothetical protein
MPDLDDPSSSDLPEQTEEQTAQEAMEWLKTQDDPSRVVTTIEHDPGLAGANAPAKAAPKPADGPAATGDEPAHAEDDPWADAPEPLRDAHHAELSAIRKDLARERGQISALQKKLRVAMTPPPKPAEPASQPQTDTLEDQIAALRDELPEIGTAFEAMYDRVRREVDPIKARFAVDEEIDAEAYASEQEQILLEQVPDFGVYMRSIGEAWWEWVDSQPLWVRQIAKANADDLVDGDGVAAIVMRHRALHADLDPDGSPPNPSQAAAAAPPTRRQRQLAGAAAVAPNSRSTVPAPQAVDEKSLALEALAWADRTFGKPA